MFFYGPFFYLLVAVLTQLHIGVFHGQAGSETSVLSDQAATAAPAPTHTNNALVNTTIVRQKNFLYL